VSDAVSLEASRDAIHKSHSQAAIGISALRSVKCLTQRPAK
jgi:hypothetical protein